MVNFPWAYEYYIEYFIRNEEKLLITSEENGTLKVALESYVRAKRQFEELTENTKDVPNVTLADLNKAFIGIRELNFSGKLMTQHSDQLENGNTKFPDSVIVPHRESIGQNMKWFDE